MGFVLSHPFRQGARNGWGTGLHCVFQQRCDYLLGTPMRHPLPGSPGRRRLRRTVRPGAGGYQTRQELTGYMGWPLVQPKALPNSSKFCTVPSTRQRPGEWGSVSASWRDEDSVWF